MADLLLVTYSGPATVVEIPERWPVTASARKAATAKIEKAVAAHGKLTARDEFQLRTDLSEKAEPAIIERAERWKGGSLYLRVGLVEMTDDELKYLAEHRSELHGRCRTHKRPENKRTPTLRSSRMTLQQRVESLARAQEERAARSVAKPKRRRTRSEPPESE